MVPNRLALAAGSLKLRRPLNAKKPAAEAPAHRILVVEDEPAIQDFAATALREAGFSVSVCGNLRQARAQLKSPPCDLALVDIGLPDGNGLELCREFAAPGLPFVFLTGRKDLDSRLEAFSAGARDFIQKPFAAEELLARTKAHLRVKKSHDELLKRNSDLELIHRARRDLTDMIVHDLKTPLSSIKGTMELIRSRGLIGDAAYKALLETAGCTADFMLLLLNDLLDVGRGEELGLRAEPAEVDLRALFDRLAALFTPRCRQRRQRLRFSLGGPQTLRSDRNLLFRVLVNLVANAVRFSGEGEEILVAAAAAGGGMALSVSDRGPGIPDRDKARIFEKYATAGPKNNPLDGGSGIGLAFCRLAAGALGAQLSVADRPGGGSVFSLSLPGPLSNA